MAAESTSEDSEHLISLPVYVLIIHAGDLRRLLVRVSDCVVMSSNGDIGLVEELSLAVELNGVLVVHEFAMELELSEVTCC